jgi:tetratricopeptide (TPR) repeat protein
MRYDDHGATADELRRAGEDAEAATRWQDAATAYEECLALMADAPEAGGAEEAALLTALGRCYWNLSEARTAWRFLRRAISLYQQIGDAAGQARATVEITRIWGPGERHKAMAQEALEALEAAGADEPYLRARLLLRLRWFDEDADPGSGAKFEEAMAIGERYAFADVLAARIDRDAWEATDAGRIDEGNELREQAHAIYAKTKMYDGAAQMLRGSGSSTMGFGLLDQGYALSERAFDYASSVNILFTAQLALMDMAAVPYARGEFERCEAVLARSPGNADFRADLYRMWMTEARGDAQGALRLMVDPARGGNAQGAMGQLHAASAGVLFRAGKRDAARQAMDAWASVERGWEEDIAWESPALLECLLDLGDEALHRRVYDAFVKVDARIKPPVYFATLQGRARAPVRGGLALKLGLLDEAESHYRDGLAWCERERCAADAALCRAGLAAVAGARG